METVRNTNPIFRDKRRRAWELDALRGLAVILMCFDHLMYDLASLNRWFANYKEVGNTFVEKLSKFANYWFKTDLRFWGHYIFVFVFLFLVGVSCSFSRDNATRGAKLGVAALAFTGVSFVLRKFGLMYYGVVFGILDCIALSILCAAAVDTATKKFKYLNIFFPLVLGVVICAFGIKTEFWNMVYEYDKRFRVEHLLGYILGANAYGDDWFGLFPYVGAVLIGMYFGKAAYRTRTSLLPRLDGKWNKPITFVGRHALLFYLGHQVVLAAFVVIVGLCLGYRMW